MPKYEVTVQREGWQVLTLALEADSEEEAAALVLEDPEDQMITAEEFEVGTTSWELMGITEL